MWISEISIISSLSLIETFSIIKLSLPLGQSIQSLYVKMVYSPVFKNLNSNVPS